MRQSAPGARLSRGQLTLCWVRIPQRLPGCSVHSPGQHAPCAAGQARACPPDECAYQPTAEASRAAGVECAAGQGGAGHRPRTGAAVADRYGAADLVFVPVTDLTATQVVTAWPEVSRSPAVAAFVRVAADAAALPIQAAALA
jgi:hypothetical protein